MMKCLDVVKEDIQEVGERGKMKCLDVVKEGMQEVGEREDDEVFGFGKGGHAGGRSEGRLSV